MKRLRHSAKTRKNIYWFFRSLGFSGIIMLCGLTLLLGGAKCYAVMQTNITGEPVAVLETRGQTVLILGHEVIRLDFLAPTKNTE